VKAVPYERFSEVVKTKNQLEQEVRALRAQQTPVKDAPQEDAIKQQLDSYLRELGYVNKEELEAKEADKQLENDMKSLSDKYSGKDGRPKFERDKVLQYAADNLIGNLEIAYKQMHEAELLDYAIKQATGKLKPTKTEVSDGSGSTQIGATQDDLLRQAQSGDDEAMKTLIKRAL
jgi:transposase